MHISDNVFYDRLNNGYNPNNIIHIHTHTHSHTHSHTQMVTSDVNEDVTMSDVNGDDTDTNNDEGNMFIACYRLRLRLRYSSNTTIFAIFTNINKLKINRNNILKV